MTNPLRLDFVGALDAVAPAQAIKRSPIPVVVMANLNQLADQVFTPRAIIGWDNAPDINQTQIVIRPTGGGGILVENFRFQLGFATPEANVIRSDAALVIPDTGVDRMETGGPLSRFLVGLRNFEAIGGVPFQANDELPGAVFVAPGDLLVVGRAGVGAAQWRGTASIREIPITPMAG